MPNFSVPFTISRTDEGLRRTVQAWVSGTAPNYGWAILPTGTDGYRMDTSENSSEGQRPTLIVDFIRGPYECCISVQPTNTTVVEGLPLRLVAVAGGSYPTYQWFKNDTAIPGATNSTYVVAHAATNDEAGR